MTYLPKMEFTGDDLSVSFDVTSVVYSLVRQVEKYVGEGAVSEVLAFLTENGHLADVIRKAQEQAWEEGAAAAWFESEVLQYGDDYPRDNPSWLPFSVRKTNPYKEE